MGQMLNPAMVQTAIGFIGVLSVNSLAMTLAKPVLRARREGSLAGLDVRLWPINFLMILLWTLYGIALGDVWIFFSSLPGAIMWLFFCLTAVELLSQEEGELMPGSPHTNHSMSTWSLSNVVPVDFSDLENIYGVSKRHRMKLIYKTELVVCGSLLLSGLAGFALMPETFAGFPSQSSIASRETRLAMFGYICMMGSVACNTEPFMKVKGIYHCRDASSIFVPFVVGSLVNCLIWLSYGIFTGMSSIIVPNCIGLLNHIALLVLRAAFGGNPKDITAGAGAKSADAIGIPVAWSVVPMKVGGSGSSVASSAGSNTRLLSRTLATTQRTSTTGAEEDIANLGDLEGMTSQSPTSETGDVLAASLPDLTPRLKELGVYEDYLKWQRDYQNWRKGGTRGARGDLKVGSSMSSAIPDKTALQALPEADEMALQELPEEVERRASEKSDVESAGSMRNNVSRR
eukprot:CAMPEP_0195059866 /NCGR_PEP_ID=MMETSP0448-20130528/7258_1 /TAXON_ID=66468 /ORGANISM="Heterocapsa triquestra, Strain CCMP 448" /LENGTH=457 /DNA_ID=CAMNT_0040090205 /DNA_START=123 /DNA_END=1496 /DNA_ORIENTATION=+